MLNRTNNTRLKKIEIIGKGISQLIYYSQAVFFIKQFFHVLLGFLFPPTCSLCKGEVLGYASLCAKCWTSLQFITQPQCACCGYPFEAPPSFSGVEVENLLCGICLAKPKPYQIARAALAYDDRSRLLLLPFKHMDQTELVPLFTRWLLVAAPDIWQGVDIITPVPLHYRRLLKRKYNQAALLAIELGKEKSILTIPDLMLRKKATLSQGHLTHRQRHLNVAGAFMVHSDYLPMIQAKTILLIDDVLTTGATVEACAEVLMTAGASEVRVLTLARVLRPSVIK